MKQIDNFLGVCLILLGVLILVITIVEGNSDKLNYVHMGWFAGSFFTFSGIAMIFKMFD